MTLLQAHDKWSYDFLTLSKWNYQSNFDLERHEKTRHEYCKARLRTRAPIKAARPICYKDLAGQETNVSSPVVFVSHCSTISAFCNGNQRFILKRHWQLSAYCLNIGIEKDLYSCNESKFGDERCRTTYFLHLLRFPPLSVMAPFLITLQPCRPAIPPAHLSRLPAITAPTSPYSLFDVYSRNWRTSSAGEQCDRAFQSSFTVSTVINSRVQNSNFLWH